MRGGTPRKERPNHNAPGHPTKDKPGTKWKAYNTGRIPGARKAGNKNQTATKRLTPDFKMSA